MAIDRVSAATYFRGHPQGDVWTNTKDPIQEAALTHAKRELGRALGRAMNEAEAAYVFGERTRDEYAVYEQALWQLMNGVIGNGQGSAPQAILVATKGDPKTPRKANSSIYSPRALAWLGYRGAVTLAG